MCDVPDMNICRYGECRCDLRMEGVCVCVHARAVCDIML